MYQLLDIVTFLGNNLVIFSGVLFLVLKVVLRLLIHRMIFVDDGQPSDRSLLDGWPVFAWAYTDLGLIGLTISFTMDYPGIKNYDKAGCIVWYILIIFSLFCSYLFYGLFIRERKSKGVASPHQNGWVLMYLLFCCAFGAVPFGIIANNLVIS